MGVEMGGGNRESVLIGCVNMVCLQGVLDDVMRGYFVSVLEECYEGVYLLKYMKNITHLLCFGKFSIL